MKKADHFISYSLLVFGFFSCSKNEPIPEQEVPIYNLNVLIEPLNSGTISPSNGTFKELQNISLMATPNDFYEFKSWSGWNDETTNPLEFIIKNNVEITAVFSKIDDDEDGVLDTEDKCRNTIKGNSVDSNGCSIEQNKDDDNDGVMNGMDYCNNTPANTRVDKKGCTTIFDIDGNEYGTITIGTQKWMSENLKTTRYNNGVSIPEVTDDTQWRETNDGAYSYYDNNIVNNTDYGKMYNWIAASKNICPENWHVPSQDEWNTLIAFAGGATISGGKLKETGISYWFTPNEDNATDEFGFSARGNGARFAASTTFQSDGYKRAGSFWSSNEDATDTEMAIAYIMSFTNTNTNQRSRNKNDGYGIRCIKN